MWLYNFGDEEKNLEAAREKKTNFIQRVKNQNSLGFLNSSTETLKAERKMPSNFWGEITSNLEFCIQPITWEGERQFLDTQSLKFYLHVPFLRKPNENVSHKNEWGTKPRSGRRWDWSPDGGWGELRCAVRKQLVEVRAGGRQGSVRLLSVKLNQIILICLLFKLC